MADQMEEKFYVALLLDVAAGMSYYIQQSFPDLISSAFSPITAIIFIVSGVYALMLLFGVERTAQRAADTAKTSLGSLISLYGVVSISTGWGLVILALAVVLGLITANLLASIAWWPVALIGYAIAFRSEIWEMAADALDN